MTRTGIQRLLIFLSAPWIFFIIASVSLASNSMVAAGSSAGNAANGKTLFEKRCTGYHSLDQNKEGPRLRGVNGRKAGSLADFNYSNQLKASNLTWDEPSLDKWVTNPDAVAPGNDTALYVSNPQERGDIIQFLRLSSGK